MPEATIYGLTPIEWFMVFQVALEAILVLLMIVFFMKLRRMNRSPGLPPNVQGAMEDFLAEAEKFSGTFTKSLNEKKELSMNLLLKLERKTREMNRLLEQADECLAKTSPPSGDGSGDKANPAAPENRALVLRLSEQGLSVEEIARKARLHRGEVELILDLDKKFRM